MKAERDPLFQEFSTTLGQFLLLILTILSTFWAYFLRTFVDFSCFQRGNQLKIQPKNNVVFTLSLLSSTCYAKENRSNNRSGRTYCFHFCKRKFNLEYSVILTFSPFIV